MLRGVGILAMSLGMALPAGAAGSEPAATGGVVTAVTIRAARLVDIPPAAGDAAPETVRAIFRDSGIEVVWRECASPLVRNAPPLDACSDLLGPAEVVVRFVPAPATAPPESLGFSYVVDGAGIARLASVYPDRVARHAEWAAMSLPALLGRVIAHEVGHLLLGTRHSRDGLMRARWSIPDLLRQRSWGFSIEEAAAMRRALQAVAAAARAS